MEKALDVIDYNPYLPQKFETETEKGGQYEARQLCCCKYFISTHYSVKGEMELTFTEESFRSLICVGGTGKLEVKDCDADEMGFKEGDSIFLPKSEKTYQVSGECEIIVTSI